MLVLDDATDGIETKIKKIARVGNIFLITLKVLTNNFSNCYIFPIFTFNLIDSVECAKNGRSDPTYYFGTGRRSGCIR